MGFMQFETKSVFSDPESGLEVVKIKVNGRILTGIKMDLANAPLLIFKGEKVMVGCGYLNVETLDRMGNAACIVTGVREFEDVLNAEIKAVTSKASELGVETGMKGLDVLTL
jgi:uncharacterized protein YunC (DUF1805 family)